MFENRKHDVTKGQECASKVIGTICGLGAGAICGSVAMVIALAQQNPVVKTICVLGGMGITWYAASEVEPVATDKIELFCESYNVINKLIKVKCEQRKENNKKKEIIAKADIG